MASEFNDYRYFIALDAHQPVQIGEHGVVDRTALLLRGKKVVTNKNI